MTHWTELPPLTWGDDPLYPEFERDQRAAIDRIRLDFRMAQMRLNLIGTPEATDG